ncbi:phosphatidylglycerol lysyltransferase domain-containing protein [Desulfothermobacter acidiphilus]|uniref:phosphatidylglycerol lysyltransferase domain-containing protein n=1 Tax=Desulfothermobacter acidiphilus TaxID=1938353 RepID=UPI003F8B56A6
MKPLERVLVYLVALLVAATGVYNVLYSWLCHHAVRYLIVREFLPVGVIYFSWLLSVFAGLALLSLAWGLAKRKRRAWLLACVILGVSALLHLLKGLDYDAALVNLLPLAILWSLRGSYTVASDPATMRQGLLALIVLGLLLYLYGFFGFYLLDRHFGAHFDWRASARETARVLFLGSSSPVPRTYRAQWFLDSLWIGEILVLLYGTRLVFRPVLYRHRVRPEEVRRVEEILNNWGTSTLAFLLLLPDKAYFFGPGGRNVIGYTVQGNVAVALGDPVGPPEEQGEIIAAFNSFCRQHDWHPAFFQVTEAWLPLYHREGMESLKIGEEAVIELKSFTLEGKEMKGVRHAVRRAERLGYRVKFYQPPLEERLLHRLKEISDAWLRSKQGSEKRFALSWFDYQYLRNSPVAVVVDPEGREVAFANLVPTYRSRVGTIDLMRRLPSAPSGVMELLLVALAEYFRQQGLEGFSLGLAPLAGLGGFKAPLPEKTARLIYEHFNFFYGFKGLRQFKAKFRPRWEPRYLIYPAPWLLPKVALAIVRANAGGSLWGYWRAVRQIRRRVEAKE